MKRKPSACLYLIPIISFLLSFVILFCGITFSINTKNAIKIQCPGDYKINFPSTGKYIVIYTSNTPHTDLDALLSNSPVKLDSITYNIYNTTTNNKLVAYKYLGNYSYETNSSSGISLVSFNVDTPGEYNFSTNSNSSNGNISLLVCKSSPILLIGSIIVTILLIIASIIVFVLIFIKRKASLSIKPEEVNIN